MPIVIRSRREGFRRCGIAHSVAPTTYPDDQFGASQLDALRCEPMLIVEEVPMAKQEKSPAAPATSAQVNPESVPATPATSPDQASEKADASLGNSPNTASEKSDATAGKTPKATSEKPQTKAGKAPAAPAKTAKAK